MQAPAAAQRCAAVCVSGIAARIATGAALQS